MGFDSQHADKQSPVPQNFGAYPDETSQTESQGQDRQVEVLFTRGRSPEPANPRTVFEPLHAGRSVGSANQEFDRQLQEKAHPIEPAVAGPLIEVRVTRRRKRNTKYSLKAVVYTQSSSFLEGKRETFLLVQLKKDKSSALDAIPKTDFDTAQYLRQLSRLKNAKSQKQPDGVVISGLGVVFVDFDAHLQVGCSHLLKPRKSPSKLSWFCTKGASSPIETFGVE